MDALKCNSLVGSLAWPSVKLGSFISKHVYCCHNSSHNLLGDGRNAGHILEHVPRKIQWFQNVVTVAIAIRSGKMLIED